MTKPPEIERRISRLVVLLTEREKTALAEAAREERLPIAEFVRSVLSKRVKEISARWS